MNGLGKVLDEELAAQGIDEAALGVDDLAYATAAIRSVVSRIKARRAWEDHLGKLLTHLEVLALTGWSKQALSQAVREHRVLRLHGDTNFAYLLAGFDDQAPARPLPGLKAVLTAWSEVDPRGWAVASWLMSPQPELGGQTPRHALAHGQCDRVATLARQAVARLAA